MSAYRYHCLRHTRHVDAFAWHGVWWLPDSKHHQVPGSLEYDGERLELATLGSLREYVSPDPIDGVVRHRISQDDWPPASVVHGYRRDLTPVTLFNLSGVAMSGPWEISSETYDVELALIGTHAESDEFDEVAAEFDWLDEWLDPPSLVTDRKIEPDNELLANMPVELCSVPLDGAALAIKSGIQGSQGPTRIHIDRWSAIFIRPDVPSDWKELLDNWVRPMQDFLTVCVGQTADLQWVKLRPARSSLRPKALCEAIFRLARRKPAARLRSKRPLDNFDTPTLVMARELGPNLGSLLRSWMDNRESDGPLTSLLLAHMYAPFMYTSQRYSSIFQAVEGIHSREYPGPERTRADHRRRVRLVIEAATKAGVEAEDLRWARDVLGAKNDKKLSQRVQEVVDGSGALGRAILTASPNFSKDAASLRAGVSHPGEKDGDSTAVRQYWHGEALTWLARSMLLHRAGLEDPFTRASKRHHFRQSLERLAEHIEDRE